MSAERSARLTREELARAVRVDQSTVDELVERGFVRPEPDGDFRPSDIQRVRAVMAMCSPGISLDQLVTAFRERLFTLQPMDLLYPEPAHVSELMPADVARDLGLSEQDLIRVMIAAGFPAPISGTPMREDDIRLARGLVEAGRALGGGELILRVARTFGDGARRAAESGVGMFAENVNSPVVNAGASDEQRERVSALAGRLMRSSEVLLAELYRRHMEHTLMRMWAAATETFLDQVGVRPARPAVHALAFVDLTGYTAITERAGDVTAAHLAERLAELADAAAAAHRGRVVKLLGDGAMLHFEDPADAVRGALALVGLIAESELPEAHAGVHAGPLIERDGDYFGRTVNLAARIAAQAAASQVLVSDALAATSAPDIDFRSVGRRTLKGLGEIELFIATAADGGTH